MKPPFDRIAIEPDKMVGQPCIRGLRITVKRVLEILGSYADRKELFADYPDLEEADIRQALLFAAPQSGRPDRDPGLRVLAAIGDAISPARRGSTIASGKMASSFRNRCCSRTRSFLARGARRLAPHSNQLKLRRRLLAQQLQKRLRHGIKPLLLPMDDPQRTIQLRRGNRNRR